MVYLLCFVPILIALVAAQSSFSPARPPAIPLAVRSPYLSTWQAAGSNGGNEGYLAGQWPSFWNGEATGWTGLVRVDNTTYTWMGNPNPLPPIVNQTVFSYTSTRSIFTLNAGGVALNVTFTSPVTPDDLLRQSFPITYMSVDVQSADGNKHTVQLYTDVSAEWVSGNRSQVAQWNYGVTQGNSSNSTTPDKAAFLVAEAIKSVSDTATNTTSRGGVAYHKFWRQTQQTFTEDNNQAAWGFWYYATNDSVSLSHQSGAETDVRSLFTSTGALNNTEDTDYRAINDAYPVFGFARDLGSVDSDSVHSMFTISLAQDPVIQFENGKGNQSLPSYWSQSYPEYETALSFFYNDYDTVTNMSNALDEKVSSDSMAAGGSNYTTLTSLAVRQAFGGMQVAGNNSDNFIFLKEISSDGDIQTVDVIFPTFPIILYLNPSWLKLFLDPIIIYREAGLFTQGTYALHNLGVYPNATGAGTEMQPLEECGNMLIMILAYAQRTGDTGYLSQNYDLLTTYTQYLVNDSLIPQNQISTDDFAGALANQTNLAIKGMVGIQAMSVIANMTGHASDGAYYADTAQSYISQWQDLGIAHDASPPHSTLAYGSNDTHGLLYNLYADALLQTHLVPQSVYQMQSNFYPTVENTYGVPLDTRHGYTKSDWQMFCAAIASVETREMFISGIGKWVNETTTDAPATDLYETTTGAFAQGATHFMARPVVGGWFSLLALNETGIPSSNSSSGR